MTNKNSIKQWWREHMRKSRMKSCLFFNRRSKHAHTNQYYTYMTALSWRCQQPSDYIPVLGQYWSERNKKRAEWVTSVIVANQCHTQIKARINECQLRAIAILAVLSNLCLLFSVFCFLCKIVYVLLLFLFCYVAHILLFSFPCHSRPIHLRNETRFGLGSKQQKSRLHLPPCIFW